MAEHGIIDLEMFLPGYRRVAPCTLKGFAILLENRTLF